MTLYHDLHGLATEAAVLAEASAITETLRQHMDSLAACLYDCAERARHIEGAVVPAVMRETLPENVVQIPIQRGAR